MKSRFMRYADPDDLVGFTKNGIDKTELLHCVKMAGRARDEVTPQGWWATTPWRRAQLTLRQMFGPEIAHASSLELATAAFRLHLLDFLTGCQAIAVVTEEEFFAVADPILGTPDETWIPPVESRMGALYWALNEKRIFDRLMTSPEVLDDWLASLPSTEGERRPGIPRRTA